MRLPKVLLLSLLTSYITSCQSDTYFYQTGKFYRGTDTDSTELYITFINDTIAAVNNDSLQNCKWKFLTFESNEKGLFRTNDLKTDTIFWLREKEKKVEFTGKRSKLVLDEFELSKSENNKIQREIKIAHNFSDKGITYECGYTIKEIEYFFEKAVEEAKDRLKNPNSANFTKVDIRKWKKLLANYESLKSTTTVVSLDVEAKNGFGNFIESTVYVYFIPIDQEIYHIEFRDTWKLDNDLRKKIKFE